MLCDDASCTLIESVAAMKQKLPKLYDFDLMEGGGHIAGWLLQGQAAEAFNASFIAYAEGMDSRYADLDGAKVLLAVGDGNHSLATAKSCYEARKEADPAGSANHPARYALVELENIHDPSQVFEPIHRILFHVDGEKLLTDLSALCGSDGYGIECLMAGKRQHLVLDRCHGELAVAILQHFLDEWLAENGGQIDYIHGDAHLEELARQAGSVGFLLPPMEKHQLFRGVISGGVLPRKTFSMGHAREKRYYLEGRKIK
jgi:hypothetical protein